MAKQPAPSEELSNFSTDTPFWPDQPMVWLKSNQEKLAEKLIAVLEKNNLEEILDILLNPPEMKYDAIKARLVSAHEKRLGRDSGWLLELLKDMELGDQIPSCLLQRMRNLVTYAAVDVDDATLRSMWMNKLTMTMKTAIVIMESLRSECTLDDLAEVSDKFISFRDFINQLSYKPSQILINMQMLKSDTPIAFVLSNIMRNLQSFVQIAISIKITMNCEFTAEDVQEIAKEVQEHVNLIKEKLYPLTKLHHRMNICETNDYLIRMLDISLNITPLHVWMSCLPKNIQEAIAIMQVLDSDCTFQKLVQLADKLMELEAPTIS